MAVPLSNETELYEIIKKEKIKIHPVIWQLLNHYIGNDIHAITLIAGSYVMGDGAEAIPVEAGKKILDHTKTLTEFMDKLRKATENK